MSVPDIDVLVSVDHPFEDDVPDGLLSCAVRAALAVDGERGREVEDERWYASARRFEISIRITDEEEMTTLNRVYRSVDRSTDVLSFSLVAEHTGPRFPWESSAPLPLGDIALCLPYARRQAAELGHGLDLELAWLAIHGTLQLIGYTHETEECAARMETIERAALLLLGFDPPAYPSAP